MAKTSLHAHTAVARLFIYLFKMKSYIKVHKQKFKKIQENY